MKNKKKKLWLLSFISIALILSSCNILSPTETESNSETNSGNNYQYDDSILMDEPTFIELTNIDIDQELKDCIGDIVINSITKSENNNIAIADTGIAQDLGVSDQDGNLIGFSYLSPEDVQNSDAIVSYENIALGFIRLNPMMIVLPYDVEIEVLDLCKSHENFSQLVTTLTSAISTSSENIYDYNVNPDLFNLAVQIANDSLESYQQQFIRIQKSRYSSPIIGDSSSIYIGDPDNFTFSIVNPKTNYYGLGIDGTDDAYLIPGKDSLVSWLKLTEPEERGFNFSDGVYELQLYKGYNAQIEGSGWLNPATPSGKGTYANSLKLLSSGLKVAGLACSIAGVSAPVGLCLSQSAAVLNDGTITFLLSQDEEMSAVDFSGLGVIFRTENIAWTEVVVLVIEWLTNNWDDVSYWIYQSLPDSDLGNFTLSADKLGQFLNAKLDLIKMFGNVVSGLDIGNTTVPFLYDVIFSESYVEFTIDITNGEVSIAEDINPNGGTLYEEVGVTNNLYQGSDDWDSILATIWDSNTETLDWSNFKQGVDSVGISGMMEYMNALGIGTDHNSVFVTYNSEKGPSPGFYYTLNVRQGSVPTGVTVVDEVGTNYFTLEYTQEDRRILAWIDGGTQGNDITSNAPEYSIDSFDSNSYFPIVEGMTWTYNYGDTVTIQNIDRSNNTFEMLSTVENEAESGSIELDNNGLFVDVFSDAYIAQRHYFGFYPLIYEDDLLSTGFSWIETNQTSNDFPLVQTMEVISDSSYVSLPIGESFDNCLYIKRTIEYPQGYDWDTYITSADYYFVKGIGLIREDRTWSDGSVTTNYITSYDNPEGGSLVGQCSLNVASNGNGTVSPGDGTYPAGATIQISATASPGWSFSNWSGDVPNFDITHNPISINMDSDKSVTANFTQDSAAVVLESISLSSSSQNLTTNHSSWYLGGNNVYAHYSDGSQFDISATVTWDFISGPGTYNSSTRWYTVSGTGTALLRATYTKDGITKTADFTFNVTEPPTLESISLSTSSRSLTTDYTSWSLSNYDVYAHYNNGSQIDVSSSVSWQKISGPGSFNTSNLSYTIDGVGTAIIRASYTKDGVTRSTDFTFYITAPKVMQSLSLSETSRTLTTSHSNWYMGGYDVFAHYDDGSQSNVSATATWSFISGPGSFNTSSLWYTVDGPGTAILRATYTRNGVTRYADFTIHIQ